MAEVFIAISPLPLISFNELLMQVALKAITTRDTVLISCRRIGRWAFTMSRMVLLPSIIKMRLLVLP
jgi:hypothetical protein